MASRNKNMANYGVSYLFSLSSIKASKSLKFGYLNGIQYLSHHNTEQDNGVKNMCPYASPECSAWCFGGVKRLSMKNTKTARLVRSLLLQNEKEKYLEFLHNEIQYLVRKAKRDGKILALRMNGTSDKDFNRMGVYAKYPDVQFCEYTKNVGMIRKYVNGELPPNLHLTLSRSELNHDFCVEMLKTGKVNVAIPFYGDHPETYETFPVVTGDDHDLRFLDPKGGYVIALKFKGYESRLKASKEKGFIVHV